MCSVWNLFSDIFLDIGFIPKKWLRSSFPWLRNMCRVIMPRVCNSLFEAKISLYLFELVFVETVERAEVFDVHEPAFFGAVF